MPYKVANPSSDDTGSIAESSSSPDEKETNGTDSTVRNKPKSSNTIPGHPEARSHSPSRLRGGGSDLDVDPLTSQHQKSRSQASGIDHPENSDAHDSRSHLALPGIMGRQSMDSLASSTVSISTWRSNSSNGLDSNLYSEQTNTSTSIAQRLEVNKELGEDGQPHHLEIETMPCAGLRIPHGRLRGLFAWRLCVQCVDQTTPNRHPKIMAHFILDLGCRHSPVSREILRALGFHGDLLPGSPVELLVQGIKTTCCVAFPDEASRLGSNFIVEGELTMYFDHRLGAPVLYVDDEMRKPALGGIGRTITKKRKTFQERVKSVISVISGSSASP